MENNKPMTTAPRTSAKIQNKRAKRIAGTISKPHGPDGSRPPSKLDLVRSLLTRPAGATLAELVSTIGWQLHSVRAGMTGLRKQGFTVMRTKVDGITRFAIEGQPTKATA